MRTVLAVFCVLATGLSARAANLDITASYKEKASDYTNLNLNSNAKNDQSFLYSDARLGVAVSKIYLETRGTEDTTMDVGILLHALGVAGSTNTLHSVPFNRVANNYPSTDLAPFIENAYVRVNQLFGKPIQATFGRQTYKLGSGMILDDDGAGLMGVTLRGELPWWNLKAEGFVFQDRNVFYGASNDPLNSLSGSSALQLYGASLIIPTDGVWTISELVESDKTLQPVFGCTYTDVATGDKDLCRISKARRSFTDANYKVSYGPLVFDGEAALERGAGTPTNGIDLTNPANQPLASAVGSHVTYNGNAEVIRAKWKQAIYHTHSEGIARISFARGSGNAGNGTSDSAFLPSHGHQFEGLERSGFGDYFGASPYSAFGGNYSTSSVSGLSQGSSGIIVVGAGYTPPSYHGFALDVDYYLLQAERVAKGPRTLGGEWDLRLRYNIQDHFSLATGADFASIGQASNPARGHARKYFFEAQGRF